MPAPEFAKEKSDYRNLFAFQKAEAIYDLTALFVQQKLLRGDRTIDQMTQAARSGKQNIVEGRVDAAVSMEMEIKLFGVARGSLHELLNDYLDYMRKHKLEIWDARHPRVARLRQTCRSHNDQKYFMELAPRLNDTEFCNMVVTLIYQTIAMLTSLINLCKQDFIQTGGIKEQMHRARTTYRNNPNNS